ncbi:hypothetical protein SAMN05216371_0054 [Streptomyces sp. TLI_053]|uniref:DUF5988 family protein n=1 Tax=Streptomyces sp. TLI_053 TaxID=1855352 RepID=UPI00087959DD|nr:DUF5988 family protein [Streptomyces sp. TLI_053]SDS50302.1 hypothetical protein SAMN05216371_0054 [Streptomyces sp. TLI_053]
MVTVFLEGGPEDLDPRVRQVNGREAPEKVSVPFGGRQHHFESTGESTAVDGREVPVLRWTYSTAIAE